MHNIYLDCIIYIKNDIKKGIYFLTLASDQFNIEASFSLGYFYHTWKFVKQDIDKSISYYKKASSFNNQYAKSNLGILYKNGFGNKIPKRIGSAIEYFKEAIQKSNDKVSMHNLAHLSFFEDPIKECFNESVILLIKSLELNFHRSEYLLIIVLLHKHGNDYDKIKKELDKNKANN